MATTRFKGNEVHTAGELPKVGAKAPAFELTARDLSEKKLDDFAGKKKILTINPSVDTKVCATAARKFNERATEANEAVVLFVSGDLPFAQGRFCAAEGIERVVTLSSFRSTFARDYGLELVDGPLRGLPARAVIVIDEKDVVRYVQIVPEIADEPDYDAALAAAK